MSRSRKRNNSRRSTNIEARCQESREDEDIHTIDEQEQQEHHEQERHRRSSESVVLRAPLCVSIIHVMPLLVSKIPLVRRLALIETLVHCIDEGERQQIQLGSESTRSTCGDGGGDSNDRGNVTTNRSSVSPNNQGDSSTTTRNQTDEKALDILLYNLQMLPHLSKEVFRSAILEELVKSAESESFMAEMTSRDDWQGLLSDVASKIQPTSSSFSDSVLLDLTIPSITSEEIRLRNFRNMMNQILLTSTKIKIGAMSLSRSWRFRKRILSASSIDEIKSIATCVLCTSTSGLLRRFRLVEHEGVKDLILHGRYDLLLLAENFDCHEECHCVAESCATQDDDEEHGLLGENNNDSVGEVQECIICMNEIEEEGEVVKLECNHWYCKDCICFWTENNATCPTCRAPIFANQLLGNVGTSQNYGSVTTPPDRSERYEADAWSPRTESMVLFGVFEISAYLYFMNTFGSFKNISWAFCVFSFLFLWMGVLYCNTWELFDARRPLLEFLCYRRGNVIFSDCTSPMNVLTSTVILIIIVLIVFHNHSFCDIDPKGATCMQVHNRIRTFEITTTITTIAIIYFRNKGRSGEEYNPPESILSQSGLLHINHLIIFLTNVGFCLTVILLGIGFSGVLLVFSVFCSR